MSEFWTTPKKITAAVAVAIGLTALTTTNAQAIKEYGIEVVEGGSPVDPKVRCNDNFCETSVEDDMGGDYSLIRYKWCEGTTGVIAYSNSKSRGDVSPAWQHWPRDPQCADQKMNEDDF